MASLLTEQTQQRRTWQNQLLLCPCPQIDQLRAELLQERSSRQDLECDKVSLERQVWLSCRRARSNLLAMGTAGGQLDHLSCEGCRAKHPGTAPLLARAPLGEGPCSQGAFPAVKPYTHTHPASGYSPSPSSPGPIPGWSILGAVWHLPRVAFLQDPPLSLQLSPSLPGLAHQTLRYLTLSWLLTRQINGN